MIDHRFKLAFWIDKKRTLMTISIAVIVFIFWDYIGIALGVFRMGDSAFMSSIQLFSEFPIEEIFFLVLLTYTALLLNLGAKRL